MPEDEFEIYLTLLAKTLRLKDDQRDAIAAELRDHMEQRLHELIDQGLPRRQAIDIALNEFGDASALAHDLKRIHQPPLLRRPIMKITTVAATICFAIIAGMYLFHSPPQGPASLTQTQAQTSTDAEESQTEAQNENRPGTAANRMARKAMQKIVSLDHDNLPLDQVILYLRDVTGADVMVNWNALKPAGGEGKSPEDISVDLALSDVPAEVLLDLTLRQASASYNTKICYTYFRGVVFISTETDLAQGNSYLGYDLDDEGKQQAVPN